jgi:hypothetical protein
MRTHLLGLLLLTTPLLAPLYPEDKDRGVSLFDGKTLDGWKVPQGEAWKVVDGVIDCDVRRPSQAQDKSLWTNKSFKDFILSMEWRIKDTPFTNPRVPIVLPDGSHKKGDDGKDILQAVPDSDSGVYLRGSSKSQVNIWCWPVGSGEVYGYRTDGKMSAEVRAGVTPKKKADKPIGEWNSFQIKLKGDRLWVRLNGEEVIVNAQLPGIPAEGPIALQHHGGFDAVNMKFTGPPSQVQFRNISIVELK